MEVLNLGPCSLDLPSVSLRNPFGERDKVRDAETDEEEERNLAEYQRQLSDLLSG